MESRLNRSYLACAFIIAASVGLAAQQTSPSDPYEGTSHPPADDTITTSIPTAPVTPPVPIPAATPIAKPSPAHPAYAQPALAQQSYQPQQQALVRSRAQRA